MNPMLAWILFIVFVLIMIGLDLVVFHKEAHEVKFKEAIGWTIFWILLSLAFNFLILKTEGHVKAMEFLTGYLIEKALSVDNIFVFLAVFSFFKIDGKYQHRILFWGILGALVMRAVFIATGISLINRFTWITYIFGAILIFTGIKLCFESEKDMDHEKNIVLRIFRKFFPVSKHPHNGFFFAKENGRWTATTLFIVLLVIESTDVIFAVDSIPAVLAVSHDPFIVYTSNVFAILGLRALYFALANVLNLFHYLKYGLSGILVFVGFKMVLTHHSWHFSTALSLGVVSGILVISILASVFFPKKEKAAHPH